MTKKLTATEAPESITMWLLVGIAVWNFFFSVTAGFEWPQGKVLYYLLAGGVIQFIAQWCLTKAYSKADASFLQPFDDLRLPFNVLAGFLAFHYLPEGNLWIGIAMIMAASAFLLWRNNQAQPAIA